MARRSLPRDLAAVRSPDSSSSPYTPAADSRPDAVGPADSSPDWTITERVVEESPNRRYAKLHGALEESVGRWTASSFHVDSSYPSLETTLAVLAYYSSINTEEMVSTWHLAV
ncbi:hypothetical protein BASA62_003187 [Batrachochytrium salamandrivorans]|nr:hypothetical protein BASA62_003187 [Batrachochytrium salamandrivorans]